MQNIMFLQVFPTTEHKSRQGKAHTQIQLLWPSLILQWNFHFRLERDTESLKERQTKAAWRGPGSLRHPSQLAASRSISRDKPEEINLTSFHGTHKSKTCATQPQSKALPSGRTRDTQAFYVTRTTSHPPPTTIPPPSLIEGWQKGQVVKDNIWEDDLTESTQRKELSQIDVLSGGLAHNMSWFMSWSW